MSFLMGINSSFPRNKVTQDEILKLSKKIFSRKRDFEKMLPVYKNSGVKSRFLVNNLNWYGNLHSWEERNYLFKKNSLLLLKKCVRKTLQESNLKPSEIGGIVTVNTTGISTPTIDVELINYFNFKNNTKRLPIFGFGCAGGVLGFSRAIEMHKTINKPILVCNYELCSLTFRPQIDSNANIVSTALFGDGAVSYIIHNHGPCKFIKSMDYTWKDTLEIMGWEVKDDGLSVVFDKSIPSFITNELAVVVKQFSSQKYDGYILHSGGMKIIKAYEKIFKDHETIGFAKQILSNYGNVSSVSVLLVLKELLERNYKGIFLMSALGPGFSAGLVEVEIDDY
ncbi:MAG: hypothetical protein CMM96_04760 [Rickettsiales bacterium]|nr:hypothetical protein [Rickettsiales bacterium]